MELTELIERYGNLKSEMDSYKKQVDADNTEIKSIITKEGNPVKAENGTTSYIAESDAYVATYSVAVSEGFDDVKLVSKLQKIWSEENGSLENPYLKMIYVPDMNAIENAIYNKKLDASLLADCRTRKETPKLLISKKKKENK